MNGTVLIVEDDTDIRDLVADMAREAGFIAACAHPAELPELRGVALVLTDLPSTLTGYSSAMATRWVTELRSRYGAPVLVLTAHGAAATDEALRGACVGVIGKPFEVDALVTRIRGSMLADTTSSAAPVGDTGQAR